MTEETSFYNGNGVTVTNTRVVVPSQTYAMSNVTSVRFAEIKPNRWFPVGAILLGFILAAGGKGSIWHFLVLMLPGIIWLALQKTMFAVALSTAAAESRVLRSRDRAFIESVVEAINKAIVSRG